MGRKGLSLAASLPPSSSFLLSPRALSLSLSFPRRRRRRPWNFAGVARSVLRGARSRALSRPSFLTPSLAAHLGSPLFSPKLVVSAAVVVRGRCAMQYMGGMRRRGRRAKEMSCWIGWEETMEEEEERTPSFFLATIQALVQGREQSLSRKGRQVRRGAFPWLVSPLRRSSAL